MVECMIGCMIGNWLTERHHCTRDMGQVTSGQFARIMVEASRRQDAAVAKVTQAHGEVHQAAENLAVAQVAMERATLNMTALVAERVKATGSL